MRQNRRRPQGPRVPGRHENRRGAMVIDPATGLHKRKPCVVPWMSVPYTQSDLEDCLAIWAELVKAIHERLEEPDGSEPEPEYGLADNETLSLIPQGFAKEFFSCALKPRFKYIAPGILVQTTEELVEQPFGSFLHPDGSDRPPLLMFRGEGTATPTLGFPRHPTDGIPTGLYFEPTWQHQANVYVDACRLVLPFELGGGSSWARTADQKPIPGRVNDMLYQIGINPYIAPHETQLASVLMLWLQSVEDGYWQVDQSGVKGGIGKFREAESEEHCMRYVVEIGPVSGSTV